MKVFVYGTLKQGFYNHGVLAGATYIGTDIVTGYSLVDLGAYPGAVEDNEGAIIGEVYYINPEILERLDILEGEGTLYKRIFVNGEIQENMEMYVYNNSWGYNTITDKPKLDFWSKNYKGIQHD